jgi:hypothetical protein
MANPKPTNPKELSAVLGISQKAVCKSIKKLADAGIIQKGELGGRQRMFNVPGHEPSEPNKEPEPDTGGHDERLSRIESMMEVILSDIASLKSAKAMPEREQSAPEITHTTPIYPQTQPISAPLTEPTIKAAALACSFNNSSLQAMQAFQEFGALFGVRPPTESDPLAVAEMISRKKSGKLENVKSPLGYLMSISGKLGPVATPPATPVATPAVQIIDMKRIERERQISELWLSLPDAAREPYRQKARQRHPDNGRIRPAVELLARQQFNMEHLSGI